MSGNQQHPPHSKEDVFSALDGGSVQQASGVVIVILARR
jgi:hypothetical protein